MNEFDKHGRKQEAWQRLRAQRRRVGQLRGRVVAISLVGFALLWAVVFAQMEMGNDPVLGDGSASAAVARRGGANRNAETKAPTKEDGTDGDDELEAELESQQVEALEAEAAEAKALEVEAEPEPLTTSQS